MAHIQATTIPGLWRPARRHRKQLHPCRGVESGVTIRLPQDVSNPGFQSAASPLQSYTTPQSASAHHDKAPGGIPPSCKHSPEAAGPAVHKAPTRQFQRVRTAPYKLSERPSAAPRRSPATKTASAGSPAAPAIASTQSPTTTIQVPPAIAPAAAIAPAGKRNRQPKRHYDDSFATPSLSSHSLDAGTDKSDADYDASVRVNNRRSVKRRRVSGGSSTDGSPRASSTSSPTGSASPPAPPLARPAVNNNTSSAAVQAPAAAAVAAVAAPGGSRIRRKPAGSGAKAGPCNHCGLTETPTWRSGPPSCPTLCNRCGLRWSRNKTLPSLQQHEGSSDANDSAGVAMMA